jgi:hypothetical protein
MGEVQKEFPGPTEIIAAQQIVVMLSRGTRTNIHCSEYDVVMEG